MKKHYQKYTLVYSKNCVKNLEETSFSNCLREMQINSIDSKVLMDKINISNSSLLSSCQFTIWLV